MQYCPGDTSFRWRFCRQLQRALYQWYLEEAPVGCYYSERETGALLVQELISRINFPPLLQHFLHLTDEYPVSEAASKCPS